MRHTKKRAKKSTTRSVQARKRKSMGSAVRTKQLAQPEERLDNAELQRTVDAAELSASLPETKAGFQGGDTQGLSDVEDFSSESVRELSEEGQAFEASLLAGVENASALKRTEDEGTASTKPQKARMRKI